MRCDACHGMGTLPTGQHMRYEPRPWGWIGPMDYQPVLVPCEACGGSGIVSCCEGTSCQPEPSK